VVNDRSVSFEFQELSVVFPRMNDECDKKHDNLVSMSYEDDQQCIQISKDQGIEDYHSNFSSHISCFELLFQEDNYCFSKRKQKVLSPLSEDETDQLMKDAGLQCSHRQEGVSEAYSTFENKENLEIIFID